MDDDITSSFQRLVRTDPRDEQRCEHILASGISCREAGLVCERCGPESDQAQRLLAESVLPRFV